jgi:hypothetical protein
MVAFVVLAAAAVQLVSVAPGSGADNVEPCHSTPS